MKFPLAVKKQLTIWDEELANSDIESFIKQVELSLEYLKMDARRIEKNELYFSNSVVFGSFTQKDYLQNLFVTIELESDEVKIKMESNTTFLFIIGLLPLIVLFFPAQNFAPGWLWLLSFPTLIIGFALRISILDSISKKLNTDLKLD